MTPMQLGTAAEIEILRDSLIAGVMLGAVYDIFRVIRRIVRLPAVGFVCDFFYALIFGAAFFVFSLDETNYYRGFILFGMLAGAVMWIVTVGRALSALAAGIITFFIHLAAVPFRYIVVILHKFVVKSKDVFVDVQPKSEM